MTTVLRLKLAMLIRLLDFLRAHPFGDEPATQVVARFNEAVARFQALLARQRDGEVTRRAEVSRHRSLRRQLTRVHLRHLAGIVTSLEGEHPQVAAVIGQPVSGMSGQQFLATAQSIAAMVEANRELLRASGMAESTPAELTALLEEYARAVSEANAARRAHTGARAELRALNREVMPIVRRLEGLVAYHFRAQPDLLGAWKSARNIAWPVEEPVKPEAGREGQAA